ncbi:MAG: FAD-dependent thymidylate synthase [Treponema sp.]|jgi:thymidylate synthase (FAD)|nr:FAD-dependent thymidylate synthase [Treponema sp.]
MAHCVVPEAEALLDKAFPVLDKGFIRLVDYLGGDERVVQAARVSYGAGTKGYREDAGLIDYLLRNQHTSPFEQVVLTFHVKLPIFVARQWIRHRTARLNEISGRYSVLQDDCYVPVPGDVAFQSTDQKQGRSGEALDAETAQAVRVGMEAAQRRAYTEYTKLLDQGIARELARINLPLSLYTELYWQIDLHNLFHFLKLRLNVHAQQEIRRYAEVLLEITKQVAPRCVASFERHVLEGVSFSREELAEIRRRLGDAPAGPGLEGKALERFETKLQGL